MAAKKTIEYDEIRASGDTGELASVREFVEARARDFGFEEAEINKIVLAVDEACSNVIRHAYQHDSRQFFSVRIEVRDSEFIITIFDNGQSFDPLNVNSPDMAEYFRTKRRGGLGIHIMKTVMDNVLYIPAADPSGRNALSLVKILR